MLQQVPQTREEKIQMYMKMPKRALSEMLINCNEAIELLSKKPVSPYLPESQYTQICCPCRDMKKLPYVGDCFCPCHPKTTNIN